MSFRRLAEIVIGILAFSFILIQPQSQADKIAEPRFNNVYPQMAKDRFSRLYPRKAARTYRENGPDEWITFSEPFIGPAVHTITFHLQQGRVLGWALDDRSEVVLEYLGEFCSQGILNGMPKIHEALTDVFMRIPQADFLQVTDRHRPVLITEYYDAGTARFANTSEIIASDTDALAGDKGLTIIKLSSALNDADSAEPIKGVLAHELAHRILAHALKGKVTCQDERQANQLIRKWGFTSEYKAAVRLFGRKEGDPVSCREE
ncbi:MAG: hypothetical protein HQL20_00885 [Candidatus Omnitrophica bacterium]|nr:hypothetical protein [Candidatus Omnitrophota bacterium]